MSAPRIVTVVGLLLLIGVFIIAGSHSQQAEPAAKQNPPVINHTQRLTVVSAVRNGGELYLALRNDYTTNIMAYAVSIGDFQFTEDFVWSGFESAGIVPNTTYEVRIPSSNSIKPVNISAALLADGNGDGNAAILEEIKDQHLAGRIQIERALHLLNDYLKPSASLKVSQLKSQIVIDLNAPEADSLTALRKLQPARQWTSLSEEARNALENAKQNVFGDFKNVESAEDVREELLRLKHHYEIILSRL